MADACAWSRLGGDEDLRAAFTCTHRDGRRDRRTPGHAAAADGRTRTRSRSAFLETAPTRRLRTRLQPVHSQLRGHAGLDRTAAPRPADDHRTNRRDRTRPHGESRSRLPLPPREADVAPPSARAPTTFCRRSSGEPIASRRPVRDLPPVLDFYQQVRDHEGSVRRRHPGRAAVDSRQPEVRVPERDRSGRRHGRCRASGARRRAGIAAVVLPVEQHPGRRAPLAGGRGPAARTGRLRAAGAADAGRSEGRRAGVELRRPMAAAAQPGARFNPTPTSSPTSTTTCGRPSGRRPSCSSAACCAKTAACSI